MSSGEPKSGNGDWRVVEVMPTLAVADLEEALTFYRALGCREEWAHPSANDPTHLGLSFGPVDLMLAACADPPDAIQPQSLYFVVEGIAAYHEHLRESLGEDLPELVDADYGMRDFSIRDPWGHILTFGEASR